MCRDIHCHLSGSTPVWVLWQSIIESGFKIKAKTYSDFRQMLMLRGKVSNLDEYVEVLHIVDKVQSSPYVIQKSVYHSFVTAYLNGCSFLELRFNPSKRNQKGAIDLDKIIAAARSGMERARNNFGIDGSLVLCLGRDCTDKENQAVFEKAIKFNGRGVTGIDIAGPYSMTWDQRLMFKDFYKRANEAGLMTTCHAGEIWNGEKSTHEELRFALEELKVKRIGHGIHVVHFVDLIYLAKLNNVVFEVCPTSNLTTKAAENSKKLGWHFEHMRLAEIKHEVCTDSTELLGTNITTERDKYNMLSRGMDITGV